MARLKWLSDDIDMENDAIIGKSKRKWELENSGLSPSDVQLFLRMDSISSFAKTEEIRQLMWLLQGRIRQQIDSIKSEAEKILAIKEENKALRSDLEKEKQKNDVLTKSIETISETNERTSKDAHFLTIIIDELQAGIPRLP